MAAVAAAVFLLTGAACTPSTDQAADGGSATDESTTTSAQPTTAETTPPSTAPEIDESARIADVMAGLTTDEKIGQLLMPVVSGSDVTSVSEAEREKNLEVFGYATPAEIVEEYHLGGVIYFDDDNIESTEQLRGFSQNLQDISGRDTGIGLLIAIDQEGGRVNRVSDEVTIFPAAAELAGDTTRIVETSYVTGQQVQQQGVNVVLAPVADILGDDEAFIGDRSFGAEPEVVADMVRGSVSGLQQSGVAAAVKHWPGHGATATDSHLTLPVVDVSRELWESRELVPFQAALEEDVAIVMVGHLALPQLDDSGLPATVSPTLVDGLLRDELGYDGVVMSDALNMGAVDIEGFDDGQIVVSALLAGVDILLMPEDVASAYEALSGAVQDGSVSPERLDEAVERVLQLKLDLDLLPPAG